MTTVSTAELDDALAKMRRMLEADGYELLSEPTDNGVSLTVQAGPNACEECLVPKEIFTSIAVDALGAAGIKVSSEQVAITYPTDGH
jgi:hypothetical protein